jgi:hypothetical protein
VAKFLEETRGFVSLAFADQIKDEFGISKEDFEAAKITGNIEDLRQKLWDFSAKLKEQDPLHFIRSVMRKASQVQESVVITDIRTEDELNSFYELEKTNGMIRRIYYVTTTVTNIFDGHVLAGSKLPMELLRKYTEIDSEKEMNILSNYRQDGLFYFHQELDQFFFREDVKDLLHNSTEKESVENYLFQYDIRQVRKVKYEG